MTRRLRILTRIVALSFGVRIWLAASPKNCLLGSGWEPIETGRVQLSVDAAGRPLWVNRFVIDNGGRRAVVLYWY
jgi:hypothetical protein